VAAGDEVTVPAQDRVGPDLQPQIVQAARGDAMEQRGEPRPVGRFQPHSPLAELALQHRKLVP
jgi:hypothetical protein